MSNNTATMSIYAQALADNRNYKNARVNGEAIGVANARNWMKAVKAMRIPAYAIAVYRHDHMADDVQAEACDQSALYNSLRPVLDLIGEVNGAKLDAINCAESIISTATRIRVITTSNEAAHAMEELRLAKADLRNAETEEEETQAQAEVDKWDNTVKELAELPGNFKKIIEVQTESAFVKAVELLLGDAITGQAMKSAEQVAAEEEAKKQARREKAKARKQAKKAKAQESVSK